MRRGLLNSALNTVKFFSCNLNLYLTIEFSSKYFQHCNFQQESKFVKHLNSLGIKLNVFYTLWNMYHTIISKYLRN